MYSCSRKNYRKKNHSQNNDVEVKQYTGEDKPNEENTKEQN